MPPKKRRADADPVLEEVVANTHEWPGQRSAIRVHAPSFVTKGKAYTVPRVRFFTKMHIINSFYYTVTLLWIFPSNEDAEMQVPPNPGYETNS